jgi:Ca2+-binding EF-hand superfamily protein
MMKYLIGAAGAALFLAAPAAAQPGQGPGGMQGEMTRAQAEEAVRNQLGRLDVNHDGIITNAEIEKVIDMISTAGGPAQMGDRLKGLMTEFGRNGQIVVADLVKARLEQFDAADANHDGKLSADERQAAMAAARARREAAAAAPAPAPKK